jgi:hypothetical protein
MSGSQASGAREPEIGDPLDGYAVALRLSAGDGVGDDAPTLRSIVDHRSGDGPLESSAEAP